MARTVAVPSSGDTPDLAPGTRVKLKIGGPLMIVKGYDALRRSLVCQWFIGSKLESGLFAKETLDVVDDGDDAPKG